MREIATTNITKATVVDGKDLLMVSLAKFYATKTYMQKIIPIIEGKSEISLRLIDWFVTNYSKKHNTVITRTIKNNVIHFNVYASYRSQLKAYSKHQFDPFRRRERIKFYYEQGHAIETTIGQLNFFRWVLQNNILEHIHEHIKAIEQDMFASQKEHLVQRATPCGTMNDVAKTVNESKRKKRNELSKSFVKNMNRYDGSRMISFD